MKKITIIVTTFIILCSGIFTNLSISASASDVSASDSSDYFVDPGVFLGSEFSVEKLKELCNEKHPFESEYKKMLIFHSIAEKRLDVYDVYFFEDEDVNVDIDFLFEYPALQSYKIHTSSPGIHYQVNYLPSNDYTLVQNYESISPSYDPSFFRRDYLSIYYNDCSLTVNGKEYNNTSPTSPPIPFTVSYTQELFEGMSREVQYPSKNGGYVTGENNNIGVNISLSDDVKTKICKNPELGNAYGNSTYSVVCCISKSPIDDNTNMKVFFENEVVLFGIGKDNYYLGSDSPEDEDFHTYLAVANGYTSILTIPQDSRLHVDFDLSHIDYKSHNITSDTKLYINVIGIFSKNNGQIKVDNGETTDNESKYSTWMGSYSYQSSFVNLEKGFEIDNILKNVNEYGSLEQIKYYKSYTINSDSFNYIDYPDYTPKIIKDSDGNTYNPTSSSLKDLCNIKPEEITDIDIKENGSKPLSPDDYKEYENNKLISTNVNGFDFNITSVKSIFDGTSDFFKFLTASISLLPPFFMTILISFFTIMLAIVIIKFVV